MAALKPSGDPTLRMYNVGFGDAFLLSVPYPDRTRHVLIDFGSKPRPPSSPEDLMKLIAENIAGVCGPAGLDAIVATHRHADHISGFAGPSGRVIAGLNPKVVIQPWTEEPDLAVKATRPALRKPVRQFFQAVSEAEAYARMLSSVMEQGTLGLDRSLARRLAFVGENTIKNKAAVASLIAMGKKGKPVFVHFGKRSGLESVLPGIKTWVLGPPTVAQSSRIASAYAKASPEYWLRNRKSLLAVAGGQIGKEGRGIFALRGKRISSRRLGSQARWFIDRIRTAAASELRAIVTALDSVMNNTSIILLLKIRGKALLFPGDAQIENWAYALDPKQLKKYKSALEQVDLYKVGHHGSLNATPRSLWSLFKKRRAAGGRMTSALSTMAGVHGGEDDAPTEVPRKPLVESLEAETDLKRTDGSPADGRPVLVPF